VKQDGTGMGDMLLESYATRNGYLNLWHRLSNPDPPYPFYQRQKLSE
jgi:hypothetical protein